MDELKKLWNKEQGDEILPKEEKVNFSHSSGSILDKMKKALFWEDIFNKATIVAVVVYFIYTKDYWFSIGLLLLMIPVIWYYKYLIAEIEKFTYQSEVKNYLEKIYHLLRTFVIRYRVFGVIIVPVSFLYGFYLGFNEDPDPEKELEPLIILIALIGMLGFYGLAELYIYLVYGRKLQKLKELLRDMEGK